MNAERELFRAVAALEFDEAVAALEFDDAADALLAPTGHVARAVAKATRADELTLCADHGAPLSECGCAR